MTIKPNIKTLAACLIIVTMTACALFEQFTPQSKLKTASIESITQVAWIEHEALPEISGLAASNLLPDRLWAINDSGHPPWIYAININGDVEGQYSIDSAQNYDWEGLASFRLNNMPYLMIADIGDNRAQRDHYTLYIVPEPDDIARTFDHQPTIQVAWTITYQYQDGPQDAESIAVDATNNKIFILNKRSVPARLYELPLIPNQSQASPFIAQQINEVTDIIQPRLANIFTGHATQLFGGLATDMSISPNQQSAVILTYSRAYLIHRHPTEDWSTAFSRTPEIIDFPPLQQAEAITYAYDGQSIYITSEDQPSPLIQVRLNQPH